MAWFSVAIKRFQWSYTSLAEKEVRLVSPPWAQAAHVLPRGVTLQLQSPLAHYTVLSARKREKAIAHPIPHHHTDWSDPNAAAIRCVTCEEDAEGWDVWTQGVRKWGEKRNTKDKTGTRNEEANEVCSSDDHRLWLCINMTSNRDH